MNNTDQQLAKTQGELAFKNLCKNEFNDGDVIHSQFFRWLYAKSDTDVKIGSILNSESNIGICADWLSGGRVEAALLSGIELANKVHKQIE